MEARITRLAIALTILGIALPGIARAANFRTSNFVVEADNPQVARLVAEAAEKFRRELAIEWLGEELPGWSQPCPIRVQVGPNLGAGGETSFVFDRGEVFGWKMKIQGPMDRLVDSVLPHEVTHTIFATHFRQPLPRWADEGACTTVEHTSERNKQQRMLVQFLQTGRGISFSKMFRMKEYPRDVLPLYAQGHSLATYLIHRGGKPKYLQFLSTGLEHEDWITALRDYYGFQSMQQLQDTWVNWVAVGSPLDNAHQDGSHAEIAAAEPNDDITYRGQDPAGSTGAATQGVAVLPGYVRPVSTTGDGVTNDQALRGDQLARSAAPADYPNSRSSNRTRQAPTADSQWRPLTDRELADQQHGRSTTATANVRENKDNAENHDPTGQTRLLLEWTRPGQAKSSATQRDTRSTVGTGSSTIRR